uniref:Octopamine receptor 2 n=1 Tax=Platynereis dumerilii TaxID=6359 RepID=A0A1J0F5W9_PLADU|nr:octopamine receptor 2 [Platynereis dumerilii]
MNKMGSASPTPYDFGLGAANNMENLQALTPTWNSTNNGTVLTSTEPVPSWVTALKAVPMTFIMVAAVFGNLLVIISVFRFERLRIIANSFIVSLAFADLVVAVLVMPFNAIQELAGQWMFGRIMCDIFNANDVLFSTASLVHLCCISMDRYIAIMDPYHYESRITKKAVALMLTLTWTVSSLISHIPIHLGWYTTKEQKEQLESNTHQCTFIVNKVYAMISSSISFWIPTFIMVFVYAKIYREARKQEKQIMKLTKIPNPSSEQLNNNKRNGGANLSNSRIQQDRKKLKREHKAAKTLGIIMGGFLCCWLPFFTWYVSSMMIGFETPDVVISTLFWVGYFNSALNPIIYAFFNRDFRNAFRRLLRCHRMPKCSLCLRESPESKALRYGSELTQTRPSKAELYDNSTSTPSPKTRRYYDTVTVTVTDMDNCTRLT